MKRYPQRLLAYRINQEDFSVERAPFISSIETSVDFSIRGLLTPFKFYVPSRGLGLCTGVSRLLLAWEVFRGRADALYWPGQEK